MSDEYVDRYGTRADGTVNHDGCGCRGDYSDLTPCFTPLADRQPPPAMRIVNGFEEAVERDA